MSPAKIRPVVESTVPKFLTKWAAISIGSTNRIPKTTTTLIKIENPELSPIAFYSSFVNAEFEFLDRLTICVP